MEDGSPQSRIRVRESFDIMMACMACMRMSLIHPVLPGGREATVQFSRSRRHLLKREEDKTLCIICKETYPTQKAEKFAAKMAGNVKEEDKEEGDHQMLGLNTRVRSEIDLDDDELDDNDNIGAFKDVENKKKGPIIELGSDICQAHGSNCCHFAHKKCLEIFLERGFERCPRCLDLSSRIHIANTTNTDGKVPHKVYCQEITSSISSVKGFTASAKIEKAIAWLHTVPNSEKVIFLSFFKASLDLIKGILTEDYGIDCARYDGDVDKEVRASDLQRFKTSTCRVLLATVQSGGTGLNITEANNICFLDRWFNPCVHDQAESRCHRLGQKRAVKVAYLDTSFTVDVVMKRVNTLKEGNASVLLADGTSLGDQWSLGYQNLSGVIGETLKAIVLFRQDLVKKNAASGNADALISSNDFDFENKLHDTMMSKAERKKQPTTVKEEHKKEELDTLELENKETPIMKSDPDMKSWPISLKRPSKENLSPLLVGVSKIETRVIATSSGPTSSCNSILNGVNSTSIYTDHMGMDLHRSELGNSTLTESTSHHERNNENIEIIELSSDEEDGTNEDNAPVSLSKS